MVAGIAPQTGFISQAELLSKDIVALNQAKAKLGINIFQDLSGNINDGDTFSPRLLSSDQSSSGRGGVGGTLKPQVNLIPPAFNAPTPILDLPEFDEKRFREISREEARPGEISIRRGLERGLLATRSDNPNLESQRRRGLFEGFGEALAINQKRAREVGFRRTNIELGLKVQEAQINFRAALAERDKLQSQAFEAKQRGDEKTFIDAQRRLAQQERLIASQQDFFQRLKAQSIAFTNQLIRDILSDLPKGGAPASIPFSNRLLPTSIKSKSTSKSDKASSSSLSQSTGNLVKEASS